ncbi:SHOCT domain-containing protein [Halostella litorea]|uniref:SHOCT domain-containing protein n=1 Tax=Halostella litorea TaxID=2528831 RepID=UPI001092B106|nr:SHOCT domain-containing protein [Halostella litorea]
MSDRSVAQAVINPATMSMLVLGAGLVAAAVDYPHTGTVFAVGFAVLVPLSAILGGHLFDEDDGERAGAGAARSGESADVDESAALETLRERYARGEIDELEYERRLEALLETESVGEAREYVRGRGAEGMADRADAERDRR